MNTLEKIFIAILLTTLAACGGGSSTSTDTSNGVSGGNTTGDGGTENTGNDIGGTGAIDLIDFSFNDVLDVVGGVDSFQPMNFDPATGLLIPSPGVTLSVTEVRVDDSTITSTDVNSETGEVIEETTITFDQQSFTSFTPAPPQVSAVGGLTTNGQRFVNVGDTSSIGSGLIDGSVVTCVLEEQMDTFDLMEATSPFNVASGVFNDVVRIRCTQELENGEVLNITDNYLARGVGQVFQRSIQPGGRILINQR